MRACLETLIEIHQNSAVCPLIIWDTLKADIRGCVIAFSSFLKKNTTNELKRIEQDIFSLERQQCLTKDPTLLLQIEDLKLKYNSINTYAIKMILFITRGNSRQVTSKMDKKKGIRR